MLGLVLATIVTILAVYYFFFCRKSGENFPPGPTGIPGLGYAPFMGRNPGKNLTEVSKKFGPIFSVYLGPERWVVLNDYDIIQEALVKQGHVTSGRVHTHMLKKLSEGFGVVALDHGDYWKSQRRFCVKTLKEYGYKRYNLDSIINEEIGYLCEVLGSHEDKSFYCQSAISNAVANIICRLVNGSRFDYSDQFFRDLVHRVNRMVTHPLDGALFGVLALAPFLRFLPIFWGSYNRFLDDIKHMMSLIGGIIEEHKRTFDEKNIRDFIDAYLKEMIGKEEEGYIEQQLQHLVWDLLSGGTETSSSTLRWCFLCLAHFPEYQENIWKEIQKAIGESGIISKKHQDQMPYTCAFIHEIMRHRTLLPLGFPHRTMMDVNIGGYNIPKDTNIIPNFWAVHHDPKNFQNPDEFRPERFIDDNNCFVPSQHVIPFSVGPRACLGEQLAKMEVFLFLVGILQKFRIVADPDKPLPPFDEGVFGVAYGTNEFHAKFLQR